MHELSIVEALISQCEGLAKKHNATKVLRVEIEVGRLSGVEAHYLQSAFEAWREGSVCEEAQLVVKVGELEVVCGDCGAKSQLENFEFVCQKCSSNSLKLTHGEELLLLNVEME